MNKKQAARTSASASLLPCSTRTSAAAHCAALMNCATGAKRSCAHSATQSQKPIRSSTGTP